MIWHPWASAAVFLDVTATKQAMQLLGHTEHAAELVAGGSCVRCYALHTNASAAPGCGVHPSMQWPYGLPMSVQMHDYIKQCITTSSLQMKCRDCVQSQQTADAPSPSRGFSLKATSGTPSDFDSSSNSPAVHTNTHRQH
jgi:hypothetical protein